jgi:hypothetical protein
MQTLSFTTMREAVAPIVAPACPSCGTTTIDGTCVEIGACERADMLASRIGKGETMKAPHAVNIRGAVD